MTILRTPLPRRTVLRGVGATVALPFLEAMLPTRVAAAQAPTPRPRLIAIEMVHGSAGATAYGTQKNLWSPAAAGADFDLSPSVLSALEAQRRHVTIVSNTDVKNAEAFSAPEIGGDHFRSAAVFLTQSHPRQTQGSDLHAGVSLDQMVAQEFGKDTAIPSLQLCVENVDQAGGCFYGYSCAYTDSISWASPSEPLPMVRDPRLVFDQLFGIGATPELRAARRRRDRSILDYIGEATARLNNTLGSADRSRLSDYLEDVREVERRIQQVEAEHQSGEPREIPGAPAGVPDSYEQHVKLMFDLQTLAFASDLTRVSAFKMSRDVSNRVFREAGVTSGFHIVSHHQDRDDRIAEFAKINRYHVGLLKYLLERMEATPDGESTLLDNSVIIYGSPMGNSNVHNHKRCPLLLAGHAGGKLKGNWHIKTPDGTPMANALLSVLQMVGLGINQFGDSTRPMELNG